MGQGVIQSSGDGSRLCVCGVGGMRVASAFMDSDEPGRNPLFLEVRLMVFISMLRHTSTAAQGFRNRLIGWHSTKAPSHALLLLQ
jgi:hypothetical protein